MTRPSRNCGCISESLSMSTVRPLVSITMMEKIIVVARPTAVPISTGLAVALNVLPAPSLASRKSFAPSNDGRKLKSRWISASMPGSVSMVESSKTGGALAGRGPDEPPPTGPGPRPRKPRGRGPEGEDRGGDHDRAPAGRELAADPRRDAHEDGDGDAHPEGAEVAGDEAGEG